MGVQKVVYVYPSLVSKPVGVQRIVYYSMEEWLSNILVKGKIIYFLLLALDWAKAFDSIAPDRVLHSLRRFGIPEHVVGIVGAIYTDRSFFVRIDNCESDWKRQFSGIV